MKGAAGGYTFLAFGLVLLIVSGYLSDEAPTAANAATGLTWIVITLLKNGVRGQYAHYVTFHDWVQIVGLTVAGALFFGWGLFVLKRSGKLAR